MEISKSFEPGPIEKKWRKSWIDRKSFEPTGTGPAFSMVIPPPNVTGVLHMGHALNNTLQDIIIRTARKQGKNVCWIPGTDHAGIATQNVVERELAKQKITKESLGREKFIETVWKWKDECESTILEQLKRLGVSPAWSRQSFTMDERLSAAVRKVFVDLYNQKLIYQAPYIVNWCPKDKTALSDIEVEWEERSSSLWHIRYLFEGADQNSEDGLVVATTRPETLLGDVAVAVHPDDQRYQKLLGKKVIVPFVNRAIPIIADSFVDQAFGSGVVKITPGHDFTDFDVGRRHNLTPITVMEWDATMNKNAGPFQGLSREECRKKVLEQLTTSGALIKTDPHKLRVGKSSRSGAVLEPMISTQWFVKTKPLAEKAIAAVESGETRFVPDQYKNLYFEWMNNIRDWCISRQIWWGHRIPVWSCSDCKKHTVQVETPKQCSHCNSGNIAQETDVLDTWFSSGLWPFSTLGWPEKTQDFATFYPTQTLVTGFDIIFFWVARMMMMGIHFTGRAPFKDVVIHGLVRDAHGKKMSKSKGNVVDPIELMDQYGTDAFRFCLAALCNQGRDISLSHDRLEGYRNFINKIWNASRFVLMNMGTYQRSERDQHLKDLTLPDQWILKRLSNLRSQTEKLSGDYKFAELAETLYHFLWDDFCDWYIEISKTEFQPDSDPKNAGRVRAVMDVCLEQFYHLAHPIIPFVTEELNTLLTQTVDKNAVISETTVTSSQTPDILWKGSAGEEFTEIQSAISQVRNIRSIMQLSPKEPLALYGIGNASQNFKSLMKSPWVSRLANLSGIHDNEQKGAAVVTPHLKLTVPLGGLDVTAEKERISKKRDSHLNEVKRLEARLSDRSFTDRAPEEIVEGCRKELNENASAAKSLEGLLQALS